MADWGMLGVGVQTFLEWAEIEKHEFNPTSMLHLTSDNYFTFAKYIPGETKRLGRNQEPEVLRKHFEEIRKRCQSTS